MYKETTNEISVEVVPLYAQDRSIPDISYYFFLYTVTIKNESKKQVQLIDRHWIITDGNGNVEEVNGEGVVGESPILKPNETYSYTSACPLPTKTGNMRGSYGMIDEEQNTFRIRIPLFFLRTPDTFN